MFRMTFITANYVALPVGFRMTTWGEGADATADLFRHPDRFEDRFRSLMSRVVELGFPEIDLWSDHLRADWVTDRHIDSAARVVGELGLRVHSLVGWFGEDLKSLDAYSRIAGGLGCSLLSGNHGLLSTDRPVLAKALRSKGLRLAFENHPETGPQEILDRIGPDNEDVFGVAFDTGWAGSKGFDAAGAIEILGPRLWHVHLKDVLPPRAEPTGRMLTDLHHETCVLGDGIVRPERVLAALRQIGFQGAVGLEHEPETHDPTEDLRISMERVNQWVEV